MVCMDLHHHHLIYDIFFGSPKRKGSTKKKAPGSARRRRPPGGKILGRPHNHYAGWVVGVGVRSRAPRRVVVGARWKSGLKTSSRWGAAPPPPPPSTPNPCDTKKHLKRFLGALRALFLCIFSKMPTNILKIFLGALRAPDLVVVVVVVVVVLPPGVPKQVVLGAP